MKVTTENTYVILDRSESVRRKEDPLPANESLRTFIEHFSALAYVTNDHLRSCRVRVRTRCK